MQLTGTLTKENFWNDIEKQYPKASNLFYQWIDEYKKCVFWNELFSDGYLHPVVGGAKAKVPKFHEIPYAMQQGIWIEFANYTLNRMFEQPEYSYSLDMEEEVKTVFKEIEPYIEVEPE